MDFRPSSLNFNYTGTPLGNQRVVILVPITGNVINPQYIIRTAYNQNTPNWLTVTDALNNDILNDYIDGVPLEMYVGLDHLTTIPDGSYSADITVVFGGQEDAEPFEILQVQKLRVSLTLSAGNTSFTVTPESAFLHLVKNNPNNTFQNFDIETSFPVSINGSNLLLANNHPLAYHLDSDEQVKISTSPEVRNLDIGVYDTLLDFKADNDQTLQIVPVKVLVTNTNSLEVLPKSLSWIINRGVSEPNWLDVIVFDPANNVSITNPSWLERVDVSNNSNLKTYSFRPIADELPNGITNAQITFTSGIRTVNVTVKVQIIGIWDDAYQKDFHFTKDSEVLKINRSTTDESIVSMLKIKMFIKTYDFDGNYTLHERVQEVNFFKNIATFDAGKYIHRLFQFPEVPFIGNNQNILRNGIYAQYAFAEVDFEISEINFKTLEVIRSFVVPKQKYVFGRNPLLYNNNQTTTRNVFLTTMPNSTHFISKKGIITIPYIKTSGRNPILKHNGNVIDLPISNIIDTQINFTPPTLEIKIFTMYIECEKLIDLQVGDVIEIEYNGVSEFYIIHPEVEYSTTIYYYNQWNIISTFEFRGGFKLEPNYVHTNNIVFKNWTEVEHRLSTAKRQKFFINTGKLIPDTSYVIDELHHAKRCWMIDKNNQLQEMIITSTKQLITDSSVKDISYELEFELKNKNDDYSFKR